MRILQKTSAALVLRLCPLRMWVLSGGLALTGLGILLGLGQVKTLQCDRLGLNSGHCWFRQESFWQHRYRSFDLRQVYTAEVDWLYRIVLKTADGDVVLTFPYAAVNWQQFAVKNQINGFLDNPIALQLLLSQDGRAFAYPFGLSFLLGGMVLGGLFGTVAVYEINRSRQTITLKHQWMMGKSQHEFDLTEVEALKVDRSPNTQGLGSDCHIAMQLRSGQSIPLSPRYPLHPQEAQQLTQILQSYLQQDSPLK